jgi:uncharacterized membrane protein
MIKFSVVGFKFMYLRQLYHLTLLTLLATLATLFPRVVTGQTISDEQVTIYAQAVMDIESHRQQAYSEIQKIMGDDPPEIFCDQPDSYNSLPEDAQKVAIAYCQNSESIVKNTGMTVPEFNQITQRVREDQELEKRVQDAMVQLQE